jgi:indolepyruvate ferredoxin oxidoreductase beta subunit
VIQRLPERPITVLIAALGGEGGGVLSNWIVEAATAQGFPVQSTSIPGVAQRTGATTYYVEIYPVRHEQLGGRRPILALTPSPGNVDVMVASELLEAARAMQNGYVSPDRTTLIASTHRIYAIGEKAAKTDGRFDDERIHRAARALARRAVMFDMAALTAQSGTVISAVLFGAIAGSGVLPLSREACEQAIRRADKGAEASLRGFAAGWARATGQSDSAAPEQSRRSVEHCVDRVRRDFPAPTHRIIQEGVARLTDYLDAAYAGAYLDRLRPIAELERERGGAPDHALTRETARYLALWMSYEDLIRVADLKTRRSRFERVRAEAGAKPHEPVRVVEFLKPGIEELCDVLPPRLARPLLSWAQRRGKSFNVGLRLHTHSVSGFLLMRAMAWLRPVRRRTSRFHDEQVRIERWLAAIRAADDLGLALEIAHCARLLKGYADTHKRGLSNFLRIFDELVEGNPQLSAAERAAAIRAAREAALRDPEGGKLTQALPGGPAPGPPARPVVWLSPKRAGMLSDRPDN